MENGCTRLGEQEEPLHTLLGKTVYTGVGQHWKEAIFATCEQQVDIWDQPYKFNDLGI